MPRKTQQQLDPLVVINAYTQGIFPMADHDGAVHWYAPDPRAILEHHNLHISRSLRATIRKGIYKVRMDTAFENVMRLCAARKET
jgi:leucyl/phenylalanyl-tRNA---protein transferase